MSQINLRFDGLRVARRAVGVSSCQFWRFRGSMRCSRCVAGVRGARWWWLLAVVLVGWRGLWAALAVVVVGWLAACGSALAVWWAASRLPALRWWRWCWLPVMHESGVYASLNNSWRFAKSLAKGCLSHRMGNSESLECAV